MEADKTALIVIDMTYQQAHRDYGLCKRIIEAGLEDDLAYYLDRIDRVVVPNLVTLITAFRSVGAPVIYTRCASLVGDGSDQTWRHRHFGVVTHRRLEGCGDPRAALRPKRGDIILTKSGSAVFPSTNCEHLLRVKGITTIVVSGIFTNSCVEGTIRLAGDLDFRCLMPEDSCAAMSPSGPRQRGRISRRQFLPREAHGGDHPPAGRGSRSRRGLALLCLPDDAVAGERRALRLAVTDLEQDRGAMLAEGRRLACDPSGFLLKLDGDAEMGGAIAALFAHAARGQVRVVEGFLEGRAPARSRCRGPRTRRPTRAWVRWANVSSRKAWSGACAGPAGSRPKGIRSGRPIASRKLTTNFISPPPRGDVATVLGAVRTVERGARPWGALG